MQACRETAEELHSRAGQFISMNLSAAIIQFVGVNLYGLELKIFFLLRGQSDYPEALIRNITNIHGEKGRKWLNDLPALLLRFEKSWSLQLSDCYADANFNYVAPAIQENGRKLVLKCGFRSPELITEAAALKYFNGIGAVRLLQFVEDGG